MFEVQIRKGATVLDRFYGGEDWVLSIDLGKLRLESSTCCVLGQLHGFTEMCMTLFDDGPDGKEVGDYGFSLPESLQDEVWDRYSEGEIESMSELTLEEKVFWDQLTQEWRSFIKDRLDKGVDLRG